MAVVTEQLTESDYATIRSIMAGNTTYVEIQRDLGVSYSAVRGRLYSLFAKTGAQNMTTLVLMVVGRLPCNVTLIESELSPWPPNNSQPAT